VPRMSDRCMALLMQAGLKLFPGPSSTIKPTPPPPPPPLAPFFPVAAEARAPPSSPSSAAKQSPLLHCFPPKFLSHQLSGPHPKPSYAGPCLQPPTECRLRRCQVLRHRWPNPVSSGTPSAAKIEPWLHPLPLGALGRLPCHRECCHGRVAATAGELLALGRCRGEDSSPSDWVRT
jgi:hypothetical protein